jgi:hypothetical protein
MTEMEIYKVNRMTGTVRYVYLTPQSHGSCILPRLCAKYINIVPCLLIFLSALIP